MSANTAVNKLTVHGDPVVVANLFNFVRSKQPNQVDSLFSLQTIVPMSEDSDYWRLQNWGTITNVWNVKFDENEPNVISFDCLYDSPFYALIELSKKFPTLKLELEYYSDDEAEIYSISFQNGEYSETVFIGKMEGVVVELDASKAMPIESLKAYLDSLPGIKIEDLLKKITPESELAKALNKFQNSTKTNIHE